MIPNDFFSPLDGPQKKPNGHGEVNFVQVPEGKLDLSGFVEVAPDPDGRYVVGHSESGHHHVLEGEGLTLLHHPGMDILYAILKNPADLKQNRGRPHGEQIVEPGCYVITNNQEYDPFTQQARRVAD